MQKTGKLTFDGATGQYAIDDLQLKRGDDFEIKLNGSWQWARVEYNGDKKEWCFFVGDGIRYKLEGFEARIDV